MSKKISISLILLMAVMVPGLTGCEPGGGIIENTPVATPTPVPIPTVVLETPTPTVSPNLNGTRYTASDRSFQVDLPGPAWVIRAEDPDRTSFEASGQGTLEILHAKGTDAMSAVLIPDTPDLAISMEKASGLEEGTDFELVSYVVVEPGPMKVYDFVIHYLNTEKTGGVQYAYNRYFVTDDEYYGLVGRAMKKKARKKLRQSIESFAVLDGSVIAVTANGQGLAELIEPTDAAGSVQDTDMQSSEGYTEEELSDTSRTRTIYRNSDGAPVVIRYDETNGWTDSNGNAYRFSGEQDVYDANDVDYYWHWEAGDVAFMPVVRE